MRQFSFILMTSAATFAVACQPGPSGHSDIGGTDTAETDTDTDSDADSDADSDSDTDADSDGPFAAVAGRWRQVDTTTYAEMNAQGEILVGVGTIASTTTEDGEFPITFTATQVAGDGEFVSADSAWATLYFGDSSVTAYFERIGD